MSDRPTPESTAACRVNHLDPSLPRYVVDVDVSEQLERQRDAYAETLRLIAAANDRIHHEAAFTALIRNHHPELTP